jgi:hypothetical protein
MADRLLWAFGTRGTKTPDLLHWCGTWEWFRWLYGHVTASCGFSLHNMEAGTVVEANGKGGGRRLGEGV